MSIWRIGSIQDEPETELTSWKVFLVKSTLINQGEDTIHFCGTTNDGNGRVCSPVQEFDPSTMRGVTRSGRIYELVGPSSRILSSNASYVLSEWIILNLGETDTFEDITDTYLSNYMTNNKGNT